MADLLPIVWQSLAVYLFIILAIRLFGKTELAQLSVVDLVFILLISNAVQNAMVGSNNSLSGGLIAAGTLFIANFVLKFILFRFRSVSKFVEGESIMLVYNGQVKKQNLQKAHLTLDELEAAAREHGVSSLAEVNLAVLEVDGNISILSDNFKHQSRCKRKHNTFNQTS
ncbi:DUF421 domain-containing protein [Cytophagaceae bacterium DM2B3-1]|uniref:DUF421 domain-containing protein n=1 Tax=Xanthocytophaga flava TaxID=3048013 RepID=A0ABT7CGB0_9BACT|nr:YetF domain-containing protein [Xanthocytophaga flavus]MDJ1471985.1 DUF421 domain-containing protein [Xanthocytophaga flavus]MDJ1492769.1 DUF421 domain-containing protein [Xanthocytophaga flavus]